MDRSLFEDITTILITLLDQVQEGFMFDPEMDFASMKTVSDASQADLKLYEKTGKYISVQRIHKPARLLIFLDINCNLRIAFQKRELEALLLQIIDTMARDVIIELRDMDNQNISTERQQMIAAYAKETYESGISRIAEYARKESQEGNIVLIVSDFLDLRPIDFDPIILHAVCLQIAMPIVSSYFHHFYLEAFKKPDMPYRFNA
ncbi:MAG: hypothetical protein WC004_03750 [Candidatus Absconditabacterales bacterium]